MTPLQAHLLREAVEAELVERPALSHRPDLDDLVILADRLAPTFRTLAELRRRFPFAFGDKSHAVGWTPHDRHMIARELVTGWDMKVREAPPVRGRYRVQDHRPVGSRVEWM